jgi:hypothetical protein
LVVAAIKKYCGTTEWATLTVVLAVSLAAGALYYALYSAGYWESVREILIVAGAAYAYILERFKKEKN